MRKLLILLDTPGGATLVMLSVKRREVLRLITLGASDKEIAQKLRVTLSTAKKHVAACINTGGVSTRAEATIWALTHPQVCAGEAVEQGLHPEGCECDAHYCAAMRVIDEAVRERAA